MTGPVRKGSDLRELIEWAKALGFSCDLTGGDHLVFRHPNTRQVFASFTPSCKYARKKTRRDILRALAEAEAENVKT
jgi:predicted RNA binding protein YcfA (HicA-like mRNA interferase family)